MNMTTSEAIAHVIREGDLTREQTAEVMSEIMSGSATDAQIAGFLVALKVKGETAEEIAGAADVMRAKATRIKTKHPVVVDTCGTGGDRSGTFNISTTAAFVVAGAGLPVAKHGNRSITSKCGSADLLAGLGVRIDLPADRVGECLDEIGIGFLYAPLLHTAMKYAIDVRRQLAPTPTVFNMLGPLTNPAGAERQVIGVFSESMVPMIAEVLRLLGAKHAFVVHGSDGLDEITTTGSSTVAELKDGEVSVKTINPVDLGMDISAPEKLLGGDVDENVAITREVLSGKPGAQRDIVLLNAAAALVAGGKADDLRTGIKLAVESIDAGRGLRTLKKLVELTNK
jgi:anthranilate phosphoribosyltransferase